MSLRCYIGFGVFCIICLSCFSSIRDHSPAKPNILIILADDMGYGDLSSQGNPYMSTPNLDFLANHSVNFKNFYVSPVCAPTRASLLTGLYHQKVSVQSVTNGYETIDPRVETLANFLKSENYRTAIFGKWHLGEYFPHHPNTMGFDEFIGFRSGHAEDYYDPVLEKNGETIATEGYITDVLTDESIRFMTEQDSPFLCYLAYNAPHTPLPIDSSYFTSFLEKGLDERTARVYGMITNMDENIGRIMEKLEEHGLLDETVILFMSDNGPISGWQVPQEEMRYNGGLRDQKFTVYEGGIRTACFWYWKDQWRPVLTESVGAHIDVFPTICDLLGVEPEADFDGISLMPILSGEDKVISRTFFQKYDLNSLGSDEPFPGGMIRRGDWKMVNGAEIYNLQADPGESQNLADEFPDTLDILTDAYLAWWNSVIAATSLEKEVIQIGHEKENPVFLQPHHGMASEEIRFEGKRGLLGERIGFHPSGVDHDWLTGWSSDRASVTWNVNCLVEGEYHIGIQYRTDPNMGQPIEFVISLDGEEQNPPISIVSETEDWNEQYGPSFHLTKGIHQFDLRLVSPTNPAAQIKVKSLIIKKN